MKSADRSDCDVALIGTGIAPLVAAVRLLAEGRSVLILNPDWDFFGEDSELPVDPLWPPGRATLRPDRLERSLRKRALASLRPDFPGAIELWSGDSQGAAKEGYHDLTAPHVRTRTRLWVHGSPSWTPGEKPGYELPWDELEEAYVVTQDAGMNPAIMEGSLALKQFPGCSPKMPHAEQFKGLALPKMCDVDVTRYRNGLLEYLRERLGVERMVSGASQIDFIPEGVRFHAGGSPRTARVREGVLAFWTPRLSKWVLTQAKKAQVMPVLPNGLRLWEEWSLISRDPLDPTVLGTFEDMLVWADVEGLPAIGDGSGVSAYHRLSVLRAGPFVPFDSAGAAGVAHWETAWASAESFRSLARLCHDFLRWDKFSVRSLKTRTVLDWPEAPAESVFQLSRQPFDVRIVGHADGPLVDVVNAARAACLAFNRDEEDSV